MKLQLSSQTTAKLESLKQSICIELLHHGIGADRLAELLGLLPIGAENLLAKAWSFEDAAAVAEAVGLDINVELCGDVSSIAAAPSFPELDLMIRTDEARRAARRMNSSANERWSCGKVTTQEGTLRVFVCANSQEVDPDNLPPGWIIRTTGARGYGYEYAVCPVHAAPPLPW